MELKSEVERFILPQNLRTNKDVIRLISKIMDHERLIGVLNSELVAKQQEINRNRTIHTEKEAKKQQEILELAMLLLTLMEQHIQQPPVNFEEIFLEGEDRAARLRVNLQELSRLIRFTYCEDPIGQVGQGTIEEVLAILRQAAN